MDDKVECSLCLDQFTDPRFLSCFHTFCLDCLKEYVRKRSPSEGKIGCPVCRARHTLPSTGVDGLQKNFYLDEPTKEPSPQMCVEHPKEDLRFFCCDCRKQICRDCKIVSHEGHATDMVDNVVAEMKVTLEKSLTEANRSIQENEASLIAAIEPELKEHETYITVLTTHAEKMKLAIDNLLTAVAMVPPLHNRGKEIVQDIRAQMEEKNEHIFKYKKMLSESIKTKEPIPVFELFEILIDNGVIKELTSPPPIPKLGNTIEEYEKAMLKSTFVRFTDTIMHDIEEIKTKIFKERRSDLSKEEEESVIARGREAKVSTYSAGFMYGIPQPAQMRQTRPTAAPAPGAQSQVKPAFMNAIRIIGQSTAQPRSGMAMPQSRAMPGRERAPQQAQVPSMVPGARQRYPSEQTPMPQDPSMVPGARQRYPEQTPLPQDPSMVPGARQRYPEQTPMPQDPSMVPGARQRYPEQTPMPQDPSMVPGARQRYPEQTPMPQDPSMVPGARQRYPSEQTPMPQDPSMIPGARQRYPEQTPMPQDPSMVPGARQRYPEQTPMPQDPSMVPGARQRYPEQTPMPQDPSMVPGARQRYPEQTPMPQDPSIVPGARQRYPSEQTPMPQDPSMVPGARQRYPEQTPMPQDPSMVPGARQRYPEQTPMPQDPSMVPGARQRYPEQTPMPQDPSMVPGARQRYPSEQTPMPQDPSMVPGARQRYLSVITPMPQDPSMVPGARQRYPSEQTPMPQDPSMVPGARQRYPEQTPMPQDPSMVPGARQRYLSALKPMPPQVEEAVNVLQAHQAKESAYQQAASDSSMGQQIKKMKKHHLY